ncbi:Gfo/Idh/MocA family protein [Companilactobacillus huachuanensis]|uniref:Gfo/Idh/MocA family protein n=1 Tax=Companilactobacillus huachuanensis TaxID=2559914 RepID=A0ABW1RQM5_9LACO|nr:Gfo/Idh/MocA family oxidoreductase [Companilactobacillus huachuanensis]
MSNTVKNLVLIGYGGMGTRHLQRLQSVKEINVKGVYDIKRVKREEAKRAGYRVYSTFENVLLDKDVDIILIATPNDSHKDIAIEALKNDKHVICEKPVTLSVSDFEEVLKVAKKYNKCFMVDQNRRWDENFNMIKKIYNNHAIGDVYEIRNYVQGSRGIPKDWRQLKEKGGGMVYDWCVHLLDRILWLNNDVKLESLYANLSYSLGHNVDDGFEVTLLFENGLKVLLGVGTSNFIKLPEWYMVGSTGTMEIEDFDLNGKYVTLEGELTKDTVPIEAGAGFTKTMAPRNDGSTQEHELPKVNVDVRDFYRNFVNWIDGKEEPIVKNSEVMRTMKVINEIFKSSDNNEVIKF